MQVYYLGFYFKNSTVSGIHHAHHQEYITASAVGTTYSNINLYKKYMYKGVNFVRFRTIL
jgi:hypothetical protein